ncbi:MAG: sulfate reduction electron transfer complex DsrMKJOP subunit DsrO [Bacillota bacterium]
MNINRRKFLKVGGAFTLGLGLLPLRHVFASSTMHTEGKTSSTGKNWAMIIDMDKLEADKDACISACHKVHNVPNIGNKKEEIKWIWTDSFEKMFHDINHNFTSIRDKEFLALCNHCENPACVRVCPTKATFKNKEGIVMMDFHRCVGCRYCMAACPYGARSFNFRDPRPYIEEINPKYPTRTKGVVEKCNFCTERLAVGLPPACVEASKNGGLVFGDLNDPSSEVRKLLSSRNTIQRKSSLGTAPKVFYIV